MKITYVGNAAKRGQASSQRMEQFISGVLGL